MTTDTAIERKAAGAVGEAEQTRSGRWYRPTVDILERGDELIVLTDLPGVRSEDIDVDFENGTLSIHGKVKTRQPEGTQYLMNEYGVGGFYRTFQVGEAVDTERISAEYGNGVLTLHLPRSDAAKPRRISVQTN